MAKNHKPLYGCAFSAPEAQFVPLWWYSIPLTKDVATAVAELENDSDAKNALQQPGIYAFEGKHDSRPEGGILYIGQVGRDVRNRDEVLRQSLEIRMSQSDGKFFGKQKKTESWLYCDVWDVVLRYAVVDPKILGAVETMMIKAHAPSFNAQNVRNGYLSDAEAGHLVVMNSGSKGRLFPTVVGMYFCEDPWSTLNDEYRTPDH